MKLALSLRLSLLTRINQYSAVRTLNLIMSVSTARAQPNEREVRINLAAAYRLTAISGWDDTIHTHISASVPSEPRTYLINGYGLGFDKIIASNLVKVDINERVIDGSRRKVNPTSFTTHGAVHTSRPKLNA